MSAESKKEWKEIGNPFRPFIFPSSSSPHSLTHFFVQHVLLKLFTNIRMRDEKINLSESRRWKEERKILRHILDIMMSSSLQMSEKFCFKPIKLTKQHWSKHEYFCCVIDLRLRDFFLKNFFRCLIYCRFEIKAHAEGIFWCCHFIWLRDKVRERWKKKLRIVKVLKQ